MRGKGKLNVVGNHIARITPAYAGKSLYSKGGRVVFWDHPRLCGEKFGKTSKACSLVGSPPPMRGKVVTFTLCGQSPRITPAYAGKSDFCRNARVDFEDHPRLCGEKPDFFPRSVLLWGSPPPMRGKENVLFCTLPGVQDHPRLCGEKVKKSNCMRKF